MPKIISGSEQRGYSSMARERRRVLVGRVVSNKMDKTVVVSVENLKRHPLYGKVIRHRRRYQAHDEQNACQIGDLVRVIESRPISKEKCWVVMDILERAQS
jgi:small subunit ribosomal protein S17